MKKTTRIFLILFFGLSQFACSQKSNSQLIRDLKNNIQNIEVSKLLFFTKELIEMSGDSNVVNSVIKKLELKSKSLERYSDQDRLEHQLTLKMLLEEVEKVETDQYSKITFLNIIKQHTNTKPNIDEKFVITQLDSEKRRLVDGYDEGVTSESRFILFMFDPVLLRNSLEKNGMSEKWKRMGVFLCNFLRDEEAPNSIKLAMYERLKLRIKTNAKLFNSYSIMQDFEKCAISKARND